MAVGIDNCTTAVTSSGSSLTWSHTCLGPVLVVTVVYDSFRPGGVTSVTYNGVVMSLMTPTAVDGGFINLESQQYMLLNPTTGTYNVVVNMSYSAGIIGFATSFINTSGGIYGNTINTDAEFGTGNNPNSGSYQYPALQGQLLFATISANGSAVPTVPSGQTILASNAIGSSYGSFLLTEVIPADGEVTYQFSGLSGTGYITNGFVLDYTPAPLASDLLMKGV